MSHTPRSRRTRRVWSITLTLAMVAAFLPLGFNAQAAGNKALQLNGTSQYGRMGTGASLQLSQFTLELWFKRTGNGTAVGGSGTGTNGLPATTIPLIAKGFADVDTDTTRDINYFFGIDQSSGKLVADFEEGAGGPNPALNHPVTGNA